MGEYMHRTVGAMCTEFMSGARACMHGQGGDGAGGGPIAPQARAAGGAARRSRRWTRASATRLAPGQQRKRSRLLGPQ